MKQGDSFDCPHCGENSFLRLESVLDGWEKKGEVLKCASCGAIIEKIAPEKPGAEGANARPDAGAAAKLKNLLGTDFERKIEIRVGADEKKFCRDCAYLVAHPFITRCLKHEKDVNPMDDCPDFKLKKKI